MGLMLGRPPSPHPSLADRTCLEKQNGIGSDGLPTQRVGQRIGGELIGFSSDILFETLGLPPCMKTIVVPLTRPTGFPMFIENRVVGQQQRVATMRRGPKTLPNLRLIPFPPGQ